MSTAGERLRKARRDAGFSTATAFAESLGISRETFLQHENGHRQYDYETAERYAKRLNTTADWLMGGRGQQHRLQPTIQIIGYVGADPTGTILFGTGQLTGDTVPPPPNGSLTAKALEVRGHSMPFVADDGAVIYFDDQRTSVSPDLLGQVVVVGLESDEVLVKRLLRGSGPGVFDLESMAAPKLEDVKLRWVARITCILPPLEARRLIHRGTQAA